jgi:hypothetical protein
MRRSAAAGRSTPRWPRGWPPLPRRTDWPGSSGRARSRSSGQSRGLPSGRRACRCRPGPSCRRRPGARRR